MLSEAGIYFFNHTQILFFSETCSILSINLLPMYISKNRKAGVKSPGKLTQKAIVLVLASFLSIMSFSHAYSNSPHIEKKLSEIQQDKPAILYIVDGTPMSAKEVDKLDPNNIEKMEFIKEKEKIRLYTDEEVDTVVLITLKNQKEKQESKDGR
jgi:hypothetical protein